MGAHEDYKGMLAAHALGSLEPADAHLIERHIVECPPCAAEFEIEHETVATLAYAAALSEPAAELRARIFDAIHKDGGRASSNVKATSHGEVMPFLKPTRSSWITAARVTAIAASLAFVALAISLVVLWRRNYTLQGEISRISSRLNQTQEDLARERESLAGQREAVKLMTGPDVRMTSLAGTDMAINAHAKLVFDRKTGKAMLMAYDLPAAPAGKAYQLWFIAEGKTPMPGQVFTPDASGYVEINEQVPAEAREATVFAVTLEPQAGTKQPTGPKYLLSTS